jgi:hypothetical protein
MVVVTMLQFGQKQHIMHGKVDQHISAQIFDASYKQAGE